MAAVFVKFNLVVYLGLLAVTPTVATAPETPGLNNFELHCIFYLLLDKRRRKYHWVLWRRSTWTFV